jgi:hypothetical protein
MKLLSLNPYLFRTSVLAICIAAVNAGHATRGEDAQPPSAALILQQLRERETENALSTLGPSSTNELRSVISLTARYPPPPRVFIDPSHS